MKTWYGTNYLQILVCTCNHFICALLQSTEEDHPDKKDILNAINCMTDVASTINEYKRRTDLGKF